MPRRVFTETWIKNLKPGARRFDYTETGRKGFMLRLWPGGERTFVVRYQRNGKPRVMTLGNWPAMTLEEAHDAHTEARKQLSRGEDPIEEQERSTRERDRETQRRQVVDAITIRNVIAEWAWHHARRQRKRPREAVRILKVHLDAPPLAGKPAHEIAKRDLVMVIDRVLARGSNVMANRLRDLIVQVFGFAAERDLIPSSPAAGLRKSPGGQEKSKERALSGEEVKVLWTALDGPKTKISPPIRLALKLVLVTAQRPGEIAGACWDEFDVAERVWTIPAARAKNGREHYVPLSPLAVELLEELRLLAKGRRHLLPSAHRKRKPDEPISERALPRALKNNHSDSEPPKLFGLPLFTPHDLRRTAGTQMTSLGIPRLHVNKLLNHSDGETTAIYDRHHYWSEKQHAARKWADELCVMIGRKRRRPERSSQRRRRSN